MSRSKTWGFDTLHCTRCLASKCASSQALRPCLTGMDFIPAESMLSSLSTVVSSTMSDPVLGVEDSSCIRRAFNALVERLCPCCIRLAVILSNVLPATTHVKGTRGCDADNSAVH